MTRCLFGPAAPTLSAQDFGAATDTVLFDFDGKHGINLAGVSSWQEVVRQLPGDWRPDFVALALSYKCIPKGIWQAPVPIIGLAPDWNLLWSTYQHILPRCDVVFTDLPGVARLQQAGHSHVYAANLFGLDMESMAGLRENYGPRDIDVLFVGNCQPAVQRERLEWLGRLARLGQRWNIVIRDRVFGAEYRELLGRSKIVFNRSVRGESNTRVFEAIAAGALLFQERENVEVPTLLEPGREYVDYGPEDFEERIEQYLNAPHAEREGSLMPHDERQAIVAAASKRRGEFTFAACWEKALAGLTPEWESLRERAARRAAAPVMMNVEAGVWAAVSGGGVSELRAALAEGPATAAKANAAGLFAPPAPAAEMFVQALALDPNFAMAGLNRAEALALAGRGAEAVAQALQTLGALEAAKGTGTFSPPNSPDALQVAREGGEKEPVPFAASLAAPHYPLGFDLFGVEWERAGWANAGAPAQELEAKRTLLQCWLHSLLADLTGDLEHYRAAEALRPDLGPLKAAFGCALARSRQPAEALPLLRAAATANPFDRQAARALCQVLNNLGDWPERAAFVREQMNLHRAAPGLVPLENWFREEPLSGLERTSIIILACNEVEFTRLCLESVLKHTQGDYELILVDTTTIAPQSLISGNLAVIDVQCTFRIDSTAVIVGRVIRYRTPVQAKIPFIVYSATTT